MPFALVIICVYVIFRRSRNRWRTATRMLLAFLATVMAIAIVIEIFPWLWERNYFKLLSAIAELAVPIIAGFRHVKAFPRSRFSTQSLVQ